MLAGHGSRGSQVRPWFSWDVETSGTLPEFALQPWRVRQGKAWLTTMAVCFRPSEGETTTKGMSLIGKSQDEIRSILHKLFWDIREKRGRVVGWNTPFDCAWAMAYDLIELCMDIDWLDAMLMWKHVENEPTHATDKKVRTFGLKKYVDTYTNRGGYEFGVDYHDPSPENIAKLLRYNKDDTRETLFAAETLWHRLNDRQRQCLLTEAYAIPIVAKANLRGMNVDLDAAQHLDAQLDLVRSTMHGEMAELGVTEDIVRSPAKLSTLLFKKWGLPVIKENEPTAAAIKKAEAAGVDPKRTPSTDKEVLHELAVDFPNVNKLGRWRESLNLRTKFVRKIFESAEYNSEEIITHPNATILGTYTSRMTYQSKQGRGKAMRQIGFALHQMKRDKRFRNMLPAPPGHDLVEFDAAGQEFRWMAIESGDTVMLSLSQLGEDPHSYMAAEIGAHDYRQLIGFVKAEEEWASNARKGGKVANLSLQYRTSKRKLRVVSKVQYNIDMTDEDAEHTWLTYRKTYPGVPRYWERQINFAKANGYVENLAGRRVELLGSWDQTSKSSYPQQQTAINFPIQGVGGDQKYLALRVIRNQLSRYDAHFAWDLHDGMYFYVPKHKSMKFAVEMRELLDNLPYLQAWGLKSPIPLPWDAKIGPTWGTLKEIAA